MKKYLIPIILFTLVTLFFTFPICFRINDAVYGPLYGTDSRGTIWQLWWAHYAFNNNLDYKIQSTVAAPFGNDMNYIPDGFLWLLMTRWLPIVTNEIFTYNFILLLSFVLSGLFAYLLAYFITKDKMASFLSGLIFAFCPYHFQRTWEHFSLAQIQWPLLYVFAILRLQKSFNWKNCVLFLISASLVLHLEFNYAYIMFIFTLLFFMFIILDNLIQNALGFSRNIKIFLNTAKLQFLFFLKFIFLGLCFLLINSTFVWSVVKSIFIAPKTSAVSADIGFRPFHYLFSQSARILNYLIPSSANPFL
ncbi:MAG: hypothetical protein PHG69_03550, partial [Candidatus Omnitrophica bacterium]|nr:hypothetical protein [Candidatus Omnitrophota bacterium]